jgi:dolichyl-phosphate beta-glucosyltransferase
MSILHGALMAKPQISVVIPAFNEQSRLPRYLDQIFCYLDQRAIDYEVIVVDDGSSDATVPMLQEMMRSNPRLQIVSFPENRGKGAAVRAGMLQGTGRLRLFADADGATPIAELERLELAVSGGAEVAVASRALHDRSTRVRGSVHRKIMGTVFNLMVQALAVPGIYDTQCGFKLFTERAVNQTFPLQTINDFGFDVEILFLARKWNLGITEVPVSWVDVPGTKVRLWRDSWRMLYDILTVRKNDLHCRYQVPAKMTN